MNRYEGVLIFHSETGTEGGAWAFQDSRFMEPGNWSYDGLHVLEDGDILVVLGDGNVALFADEVKLPPRQNPYAPNAYAPHGLTAHRRPPEGTEAEWWFEERKAVLLTERR